MKYRVVGQWTTIVGTSKPVTTEKDIHPTRLLARRYAKWYRMWMSHGWKVWIEQEQSDGQWKVIR